MQCKSKNDDRVAISGLLIDIECELRRLHVWEEAEPPAEALASTQPFAVDTLSFTQWLQFIFIPRIRYLVENEDALPIKSDIAPMGEEYFRGLFMPADNLIETLREIDEVITRCD